MFEAPNRVTQLLADLAEVCGPERHVAVSRELTKVFEETRAGTLQELSEHYAAAPARGEVTVVLSGTGKQRVEEPPPLRIPASAPRLCLLKAYRAKMWLIDLLKKPESHGMRRTDW